MPHSANAKKRHRQSLERREKNRSIKRELKTRVRKVVESVEAGKADVAQSEFRVAVQKLDPPQPTARSTAIRLPGPSRDWPRGSRSLSRLLRSRALECGGLLAPFITLAQPH